MYTDLIYGGMRQHQNLMFNSGTKCRTIYQVKIRHGMSTVFEMLLLKPNNNHYLLLFSIFFISLKQL